MAAVGRGGGGIVSVDKEKLGGGGMLLGGCEAEAFGVVGESGCSSCSMAMVGAATLGTGGGGMAARSATSSGAVTVGGAGGGTVFPGLSFSSRRGPSVMVAAVLRWSHDSSVGGSHEGGRMMT